MFIKLCLLAYAMSLVIMQGAGYHS